MEGKGKRRTSTDSYKHTYAHIDTYYIYIYNGYIQREIGIHMYT